MYPQQRKIHNRHRLEGRRLSWYACIFDEPQVVTDYAKPGDKERTTYTEIVRQGAFLDSLATGNEVIACIDHDRNRMFATTKYGSLTLAEDPKGLWCSCWLPENDLGEGIMRDVEGGKLDGGSFRWSVATERSRWSGSTCEVIGCALEDVTLTGSPAHESTVGEVHLRMDIKKAELEARISLLKFRLAKIHKGNCIKGDS